MLSINEEGSISVVNPSMSTAVQVPHRRQVLSALRGLHKITKKKGLAVTEDLNTICRFFGVTIDKLDSELLK